MKNIKNKNIYRIVFKTFEKYQSVYINLGGKKKVEKNRFEVAMPLRIIFLFVVFFFNSTSRANIMHVIIS
jgi:hypothetical protein